MVWYTREDLLLSRYSWTHPVSDFWLTLAPKKGKGRVRLLYRAQEAGFLYDWSVGIFSGSGESCWFVGGIEDTLEEAKRQVEDALDMIEEY